MSAALRHRKAIVRYRSLRNEVSRLSPAMAAAMLSGLDQQPVVVGQYSDGSGGACPLLAGQRAGGPLNHSTRFPDIWDAFCKVRSYRKARKASRHELVMLRMLLNEHLMPLGERSMLPTSIPEAPAPIGIDWESEVRDLLRRAQPVSA